jgi:hypothetical protein
MKTSRILFVFATIIVAALILSACSPVAAPVDPYAKVNQALVDRGVENVSAAAQAQESPEELDFHYDQLTLLEGETVVLRHPDSEDEIKITCDEFFTNSENEDSVRYTVQWRGETIQYDLKVEKGFGIPEYGVSLKDSNSEEEDEFVVSFGVYRPVNGD